MEYKLEELTKRVDKHNNTIERTYNLEQRMAVSEEQIRVALQIWNMIIRRINCMNINVNEIMNYVTYALIAFGLMAFVVSLIVQAIKDLPWFKKLPTSAVALITSFIVCTATMVAFCEYFKIVIEWYYVFAAIIASFVIYMVATGGWERVKTIWDKTKYKKYEGE